MNLKSLLILFMSVGLFLSDAGNAAAQGTWHFPWQSGEWRRIDCGYGCGKHTGVAYHALDLNWGGGDDDCGRAVVAIASGSVRRASCSDRTSKSGYGCYVELAHSPGPQSFYAHLQEGSAKKKGSAVCRGQTIGRVGKTGSGGGPTCHLHFHMTLKTKAFSPEPMWGKAAASPSCSLQSGFSAGQIWYSCTGWDCQNPQ